MRSPRGGVGRGRGQRGMMRGGRGRGWDTYSCIFLYPKL